ncbi:PduO protein [Acrocarpospora pleiomorpha]|uniref:PduO protein n=1 Tax=Acrocarpospora pleiomorpha TaxID=90975 RepID=A0A5M3XNJ5_9ACTN|nr:heme-binding protein [Acrocarpospora pleiomorpha]GES22510.1 PduO protein [Acrocarpospora pleiomorpha]
MATRLNLAHARTVLDAALAKAVQIGQPMNVAVVDDGGHLIAFARQDGAILGSIDIAVKKARTAALLKMTTEELGKAAAPGSPLYGIEVSNGGLIIFGGGVPLTDSHGDVVGAVGVSAGTVDQDQTVAHAGADALT